MPPKALKLPHPGAHLSARPNASELLAVRQLQHYVDALTLYVANGHFRYPSDLPQLVRPELPDRMVEWKVGVQRPIYRALIITTALVGPYSEPLFEAHKSHDFVLKTASLKNAKKLEHQVLEFLHGFPIYKLRPSQDEENGVFRFLAEWVFEQILADAESRKAMAVRFDKGFGRAMECRLRGDCPLKIPDGKNTHSDAHLVALEIMRVFWMCENINGAVRGKIMRDSSDAKLRRIGPVCLFGTFDLRVVNYTEAQDSGHSRPQFISSVWPGVQENNYKINMYSILRWIQAESGEPNHLESNSAPTTPLRLKFFDYFLREYLGAAFFDGLFYEDPGAEINDDLETFLQCATLFSLDDVVGRERKADDSPVYDSGYLRGAGMLDGSEVLVSADPKPNVYFSSQTEDSIWQ